MLYCFPCLSRFRKTSLTVLAAVAGLVLATSVTAQIQYKKATLYGIGTVYESYAGACGQAIPGTEGLLSFCDREDNLIFVRESRGLNSAVVSEFLPSAIDYDFVGVTGNGITLKRGNQWINVPDRAFFRPDAATAPASGGTFSARTGLVNGANQLLVFWANLGIVDLNTMASTRIDADPVPGGLAYPTMGVYDATRRTTWVISQGGTRKKSLYRLDDGTTDLRFVNAIDAPDAGQWSGLQDEIHLRNDSLYITSNSGLYVIDIRQPEASVPTTRYAKAVGNLPLRTVSGLGFSTTTNDVFLTGGNEQARGRLVRWTPRTGATDTLVLTPPDNNTTPVNLREIGVGPNDLVSVAGDGYFGVFDVDWSAATPAVTAVDEDVFEANGYRTLGTPTDITYRRGRFYYGFNNNTTGGLNPRYVVVTRSGASFDGFTGNDPGQLTSYGLRRFTDIAPGPDGEVWFVNGFDDIIAHVRDGQVSVDYRQRPQIGSAISDAAGRLHYKDGGRRLELLDPPVERTVFDDVRQEISALASYGEQIWAYSSTEKSIYLFENASLVRSSPLTPNISTNTFSKLAVDTSGTAWLVRLINNDFEFIKHDIQTNTSERIVVANQQNVGALFKVLPAPAGGLWLLGSLAPAYFDGTGVTVFDRSTYPDLAGARDGVVTTDGKLHLISADDPKIATLAGAPGPNPTVTVTEVERAEFPLFDLYRAGTITFDTEGDLWISGQRDIGFLEFDLADTATVFRPGSASNYLTGRVYHDQNANGAYDEGEGVPAITVAFVPRNGTVSNLATDEDGRYEFLLSGFTGELRVVLPRLPQYMTASRRVDTVVVTSAEADLAGADFVLTSQNYEALYLQSANRTGAWGFDRPGFRNAFTAAVTNLSRETTFQNVDVEFAYVNQTPGSQPLPKVAAVKLYRVRPLSGRPVNSAIAISPKTHAWRIGQGLELGRDYTIDTLTAGFTVDKGMDTVRVLTDIARIEPQVTYVIEIETERYRVSGTGSGSVSYGYSNIKSDGVDSPPRSSDDLFIIPGGDDDGGGPRSPLRDGNSPYIDPKKIYSDPYSPPKFRDPTKIYIDPPFRIPLFSSYDPNDKLVDGGVAVCAPDNATPGTPPEECPNATPTSQRDLVYTIRFENEGNFSAKDVYIIDTFDTKLAASSISVLATSHPMALEFLPPAGDSTVVRFAFRDIYLPFADSVNDGWVRFAVRTEREPTIGQEVRNTAAIYFDQNPPIYTNVIRNLYFESSGFAEAEPLAIDVRAYPNPTSGEVTLVSEAPVLSVEVYDVRGALLLSPKPTSTLSLSGMPAGVYVVRVTTAGGVGVARVVLE